LSIISGNRGEGLRGIIPHQKRQLFSCVGLKFPLTSMLKKLALSPEIVNDFVLIIVVNSILRK